MAQFRATGRPPRPAWIELDLDRLRSNFRLLHGWKERGPQIWAVVKDNAYGHGIVAVSRVALQSGAIGLAVNTLAEAAELRAAGIHGPILVLGERDPEELPFCIEHGVLVSVGDLDLAGHLNALALKAGCCVPIHLKIDTGMGRFGIRWDAVDKAASTLRGMAGLVPQGIMSHFAMSDEADKTFAREQAARFLAAATALRAWRGSGLQVHLCNSGGFLDLPEAHHDAVRLGILPLGVHPSESCRRIEGLLPVMSVRARVVTVRDLKPGETYGYGMRYRAVQGRRIGVLPLGYGDGYPRLVNKGQVLVRGCRVPIVGSVAMDATGIDLSQMPEVTVGEEVVLLGEQGTDLITAGEIAGWAGTVSYDILAGWRDRLPRVYMEEGGPS